MSKALVRYIIVFFIGLVVAFICFFATGGGHTSNGTLWPFAFFFPLPTLALSYDYEGIGLLFLLCQFPLYLFLVDITKSKQWKWIVSASLLLLQIALVTAFYTKVIPLGIS
jgi:hypothetical protein